LYQHLRSDVKCRNYARYGHFAIWGNDKDELVVEPYAHAVGPGPAGGPDTNWHELDFASFKSSFEDLYSNLHNPDMNLFSQNSELYGAGLGLPVASMQEYLKCILQYCIPLPTSPGIINNTAHQLLVGYTQANGPCALALASFEGLIVSCARFAAAVHSGTHQPLSP
jgi:hypothetical protein